MKQKEKNTRNFLMKGEKNFFNRLHLTIKNEKYGITLIALIVTIIVLLILARSFNYNVIIREWNIN